MSTSLLSTIRSNRRELRSRGCTASQLLILEAVAFKASGALCRLSVAAIGRLVGISRSVALRHIQKLEAIGAIIRLPRAILLNTSGILKWCAAACNKRVQHLKALFIKRKKQNVVQSATHREERYSLEPKNDLLPVYSSVADARSALLSCYIPLHLRSNR
jgi:hypothetical protein